jgi:glycine hydroxymethyltransferase
MSGKEAEVLLEHIGVSCNKNQIPFDTRKPMDPSGIRLGTPAITTRGFTISESAELAHIIVEALKNKDNTELLKSLKEKIKTLCIQYPIP